MRGEGGVIWVGTNNVMYVKEELKKKLQQCLF